MVHFLVTSTAKDCPWARHCIRSVETQDYDDFRHVYIAADKVTYQLAKSVAHDPRTKIRYSTANTIENVYTLWQTVPDSTVIVWLDGDDWLAGPNVLDYLAYVYEEPEEPWLTYGSFRWSRYPGFDAPQLGTPYQYAAGETPRNGAWRASHLKTFRAGLVKKVLREDLLRPDGSWAEYCTDRIFMLPMLEMAGMRMRRVKVIKKELSVYNVGASFMLNNKSEAKRADEEAERLRIHALPPYELLLSRPW